MSVIIRNWSLREQIKGFSEYNQLFCRGVKLVILDEAHNIANPPQNYKRYEKQFSFLANHLSDCVTQRNVKVVPLTATPIREDVNEMAILLNMVSKKKKFPITKTAFLRKYDGLEGLKMLKKATPLLQIKFLALD